MRIVRQIIEIVGRDLAVCGLDNACHNIPFGNALSVSIVVDSRRADINKVSKDRIGNIVLGKVIVQGHDSKINIMLNCVNAKINGLSLYSQQQNVDCPLMDNNIRKIRNSLDMTQGQLAELVGCTTQQIQLLESGKRGLDVKWMTVITQALNAYVGTPKFKIWNLITDEQVDELTEDEKKLISVRRALEDNNQKAFDAASLAVAESLKKIEKN